MLAKEKVNYKFLTNGLLIFVVIAVCLFFYFDRHNELTSIFRSWGFAGVVVAVVLRGLVSATPIPSEGLMILYMKIYTVWWGVFFCWFGSIFGSLLVFFIAKRLGKPILESIITAKRFDQIDSWVEKHGTLGLLFVQLLPIPGFIVSYAIGTMPSVGLWRYVWTGAVSIIPYYIGSALIYLGFSKHLMTWLGGGAIAMVALWFLGYRLKKRWQP